MLAYPLASFPAVTLLWINDKKQSDFVARMKVSSSSYPQGPQIASCKCRGVNPRDVLDTEQGHGDIPTRYISNGHHKHKMGKMR
jgi:hypothetical protein